ncbi:hypothetical protein JZ751_029340 [Albula glossodonta]|uniref:Uncharacterized protein n=1 Tax=Albula glossodonta TaxID=121402 RepID=A0A8T2PHB8_9TELE|nr:hypothetical protein JZ751_029340 [Albula glossodonta]
MDVTLSVSLLRDQMGTVIEQAVTAAVETVLGEMVKVVGCKLEEYSKEMSAKEKENESIRQMLELSQCQMKTMRKYLSAVIAKDERQALVDQRNVRKQNESNRIYRMPVGETPRFRGMKRTLKEGEGTLTSGARTLNRITQNPNNNPSERLVQVAKSSSPRELAPESVTRQGKEDSFDSTIPSVSKEAPELPHLKEECSDHPEVESDCQRKETNSCEPTWGARQQAASQGECMVTLDSAPQSPVQMGTSVAPDTSASTVWDTRQRTKEEEAEIEIICIKEEPEDLEVYQLTPQCSNLGIEQGNILERTQPVDTEHTEELTEASLAAVASFMYPDPQRSQAGAQRPARWRYRMRDPSLFEEHKHRKAELKRRSQHRRREREKSLPQPLLAALERERREKNRIRVARWRAKRKLQAGLVTSQPAQFNYPPAQTVHVQHNDKVHGHPGFGAAPQPSNLLYSSPQCENSSLYSSLQFNSNPLLAGLRHDT